MIGCGFSQVDLGGLVHGLTPLAAACPSIHIFDRPTLALGALWLPYRKGTFNVEALIGSAEGFRAVFGHADVVWHELAAVMFEKQNRTRHSYRFG